jgi:hypothetical protein
LLETAGQVARDGASAHNGEVSRQTEGAIPELLPAGVIEPGITTMILTNSQRAAPAWAM